ncbi:MAG: MJ0042-type zinc finger domain-containing protein [Tardiphaga sp.]
MHIVCPHCTTAYAVDPAPFGDGGRTVRCARCKEVWLARPENLRAEVATPAMASVAEPESDLSAWGITDDDDNPADMPEVVSPSISTDWPTDANQRVDDDWTPSHAGPAFGRRTRGSRFGALRRLVPSLDFSGFSRRLLPIGTAAMAAALAALLIWRVDIVRLMPQTAAFYRAAGLNVNVRGLAFKDVKVSSETVDGKPVLVIEGLIVSETRTPTAMPRLRFVVRDDHGSEIYAWSAVLEQPGLNPGDKAWFRSRLASPPAEGRSIDVRFFNRRDIAGSA